MTQMDKFRIRREQHARMLQHLTGEVPLTEKQIAAILQLGMRKLVGRQRLPGEELTDEDFRVRIYSELEHMEAAE